MNESTPDHTPPHESEAPPEVRERYERPRITTLGTLTELTLGGNASEQADAFGAAGASGVI